MYVKTCYRGNKLLFYCFDITGASPIAPFSPGVSVRSRSLKDITKQDLYWSHLGRKILTDFNKMKI